MIHRATPGAIGNRKEKNIQQIENKNTYKWGRAIQT